jgi:hypothetical protein
MARLHQDARTTVVFVPASTRRGSWVKLPYGGRVGPARGERGSGLVLHLTRHDPAVKQEAGMLAAHCVVGIGICILDNPD